MLICDCMQSGSQTPTFRTHLLFPSSGYRNNQLIAGRVLISIGCLDMSVSHVAGCIIAKHNLPACFNCYGIFKLRHCLSNVSVHCCRYKHCLVVIYCYQLPCNVPSCKVHMYRGDAARQLISSAVRISEGSCLGFHRQVICSCITIRNVCGINQMLRIDKVLQFV